MVTMVNNGGNSPVTFFGLSTDTKPSKIEYVKGNEYSIPNASFFYEMDTSDIYMYNAEGETWLKQNS